MVSARRVAALYDVHGNLPALRAVLADPRFETATAVVSGGDLVAGPMPSQCLDLLSGLGKTVSFLRGNGDRETIAPPPGDLREEAEWCARRLTPTQRELVAGWPLTQTVEVEAVGQVLFCHATPTDDARIVTAMTPNDAISIELRGTEAALVVCGHTHVQFDRRVGPQRLVNAGSVGMPYEGSAEARWALIGPDVELVSTAYDALAGLTELGTSGYPLLEERFGPVARGEISAEEAIRSFEERRGA